MSRTRLFCFTTLTLAALGMLTLSGCGGDAQSTVAQAGGDSEDEYGEGYDGEEGGYGANPDAASGNSDNYGDSGEGDSGEEDSGEEDYGGEEGGYGSGYDGEDGGYGGEEDEDAEMSGRPGMPSSVGGGGSNSDSYASQAGGYGDYGGYGSGGMSGGDEGEEGGDMYSGYEGGEPGYGGEGEGEGDQGYGGYNSGNGMGGYGSPGFGGPGMGGGANINQMTQMIGQNCLGCHGPRQQKGDIRLDGLTGNFSDPSNTELWKSVLGQLEAGTMPPPPRRIAANQKQMLVSFIRQAFPEGAGFGEDEDYFKRSKYAFGIGKERDAVNYLYAHAISENDEESKKVLEQSRWFAMGRKPTTAVRFAVGVILKAPSTLTDVKPIGTSQFGGGGGGGGGYGGGEGYGGPGMGGPGGGNNSKRGRSFSALTGSFGEALVAEFESRWSSGQMGSVFSEVVAIEPRRPQRGAPGMGGGPGMGGFGGEGGYGGESGYGGYGGEGGEGGYGGYGGGGESGSGSSNSKQVMAGGVLTPGLTYLGTGSQKELLEKAAEEGVDGLFIFDVEAAHNRRTGIVNNETRLRLMPLEGKPFGATSRLANTEIERAQLRGTESDDVQKNIERLFRAFDENVQLTALPSFKHEHAIKRISQLLTQREALPENDESNMDMQVLYETKLFYSLGIIAEDEMSMVFQIVLEGNEGETLATGNSDDRKLVLDGMLTSYGN